MKELMLCGHPVRVNDHGLVCATDMHKAGGSRKSKEPRKWLILSDVQELMAELNRQNLGGLEITRGRYGGTWISRFAAYKYAGWMDKPFEVGAMKVLDAYFSGELKTERQYKMQAELQQFAFDEGRSKEGGTIGSKLMLRRKKEKHHLEVRAIVLLKKYQLDLFNKTGTVLL